MNRHTTIDVSKSLYDSDGYRHTLVRATPLQIITLVEGLYWLWDRRTGQCLIEGMGSTILCNHRRLSAQGQRRSREQDAQARALFLARQAMRNAAASSALAVAETTNVAPAPAAALIAAGPPLAYAPLLQSDPQSTALQQAASPQPRSGAGSSFLGAALVMALLTLALVLPELPNDQSQPVLDA